MRGSTLKIEHNRTLTNEELQFVKNHLRNRPYMSGIDRDLARVKTTQEVFTPIELVQEVLSKIPEEYWEDEDKTAIDPAMGDCNFLSEVLIKKLEHGHSFKKALSTICGIDFQMDNCLLSRKRMLCKQYELEEIVQQNLICADSLKVKNWKFDGTDPYKTEEDFKFDSLFD